MDIAQTALRLRAAYALYHNRQCHYFDRPPVSVGFIMKPSDRTRQMSMKLAARLAEIGCDDPEGYVRAGFDRYTDPYFSMLLSEHVMKRYQERQYQWEQELTDELQEQYSIIKGVWYSIPPELPVETRLGCLLESIIRPCFQEREASGQRWTTSMNGIYLLAFVRSTIHSSLWEDYHDFLTSRAKYDFLLWPAGYLRHSQWAALVHVSGVKRIIEGEYAYKE